MIVVVHPFVQSSILSLFEPRDRISIFFYLLLPKWRNLKFCSGSLSLFSFSNVHFVLCLWLECRRWIHQNPFERKSSGGAWIADINMDSVGTVYRWIDSLGKVQWFSDFIGIRIDSCTSFYWCFQWQIGKIHRLVLWMRLKFYSLKCFSSIAIFSSCYSAKIREPHQKFTPREQRSDTKSPLHIPQCREDILPSKFIPIYSICKWKGSTGDNKWHVTNANLYHDKRVISNANNIPVFFLFHFPFESFIEGNGFSFVKSQETIYFIYLQRRIGNKRSTCCCKDIRPVTSCMFSCSMWCDWFRWINMVGRREEASEGKKNGKRITRLWIFIFALRHISQHKCYYYTNYYGIELIGDAAGWGRLATF